MVKEIHQVVVVLIMHYKDFKKLKNMIFIEKAKKVHGSKYDYSLVKYINNYTKVKIICSIHGVFEQRPKNHLNGQKCPFCSNVKKYNTTTFIEKAEKVHNLKYDYSLVKYKNNKTKVKIICPMHGVFEQIPDSHLKGYGCSKCGNSYKYSLNDFIEKAKKVHETKYDYSLVKYKNNKTKVKIICPVHGVFEQRPDSHLKGQSCSKCVGNGLLTTNLFIEKAKKVHGTKYNYSLVEYKNNYTKVKFICPVHGVFEQKPNNHLNGSECNKCSNIKKRLNMINIINYRLKNNYQITPNFNPKACEIFDKISLKENIHIQHAMNGGEFYIKELGYWIDGYDVKNNVVYEFDEKYHKFY